MWFYFEIIMVNENEYNYHHRHISSILCVIKYTENQKRFCLYFLYNIYILIIEFRVYIIIIVKHFIYYTSIWSQTTAIYRTHNIQLNNPFLKYFNEICGLFILITYILFSRDISNSFCVFNCCNFVCIHYTQVKILHILRLKLKSTLNN